MTAAGGARPAAPYFVGRASELALLDAFVGDDTRVLNLYGPGGIGKSAVTRRWEVTARASGHLVASRDVADGVAPAGLLYDLRMQIAACPGVATHAFADFDEALREHLMIEKVLAGRDGANAVFDAVGNLQDPLGLSAAVAGLGKAASERVRRRLTNRAALDRYWRGTDGILAGAFLASVQGLARSQASVVLVLDTFENAGPLDDWACRHLVPGLPPGVRLLLVGRNELTRTNFDWQELGDELLRHPLADLSAGEAAAYLQHHGLVDRARLDHALELVGGYPLLLMLLCQLARSAGGWAAVDRFTARDRDELAGQLLDRIMREERAGGLRELLERAAVAPWLRPDVIAVLLETDLVTARTLYDDLGRHSFAERHPFGIRLHDKIRELLAARFAFTDPRGHRAAVDRLAAHLDVLASDDAGSPA